MEGPGCGVRLVLLALAALGVLICGYLAAYSGWAAATPNAPAMAATIEARFVLYGRLAGLFVLLALIVVAYPWLLRLVRRSRTPRAHDRESET